MRFQPYPSDLRLNCVRRSIGLTTLGSLSQLRRLTSASCSSDWLFAIGFLHQIVASLTLPSRWTFPFSGGQWTFTT